MLFSKIVNLLNEQCEQILYSISADDEIDEIIILNADKAASKEIKAHSLYVSSNPPQADGAWPGHMLLPVCEPAKLPPSVKNWIMVAEAELPRLTHYVKTQLIRLINTYRKYNGLLSSVVKKHDLTSVLTDVQMQSSRSALLVDIDGKIIACSQPFALPNQNMQTYVKEAYMPVNVMNPLLNLTEQKQNDLMEDRVFDQANDLYLEEEGLHILFSPVYYEKSLLAFVLLIHTSSVYDSYCAELLPLLNRVSHNMLTHEFETFSPLDYRYRSLLLDLIKEEARQDFKQRIRTSSLRFPPCMAVVVLRAELGPNKPSPCEVLHERIKEILPDAIYIKIDDLMVYLLEVDENEHLSSDTNEALRPIIVNNQLRCGMSQAFYHIKDFGIHFEQAKKALDYSLRRQRERVINLYEDCSFYDLVSQLPSNIKLIHFIHSSLSLLKLYDRKNDSKLFETLKVLTETGFSMSKTAEILYLHRNSLTYRKQRIEEICGLDFNDPELNFKLMAAFILDEINENRGQKI